METLNISEQEQGGKRMAKIYRRDTLVLGVSPKKKNEKNRKRNTIVNFRVTPEEKQLLEDEYQDRLAFGIFNGILDYFNE